jgi:hypothetical protein
MRLHLAGLVVTIGFLSEAALAGDNVAYQLETKKLAAVDGPKLAEPLTVQFKDRDWATPGLEEALGDQEVCGAGRCREIRLPKPKSASLENEVWPRTLELFYGPDARALGLVSDDAF